MVQKKLNTKKLSNSKPSLNAYLKQAQSFRKTRRNSDSRKLLRKAALAAIIPLAAITKVDAQCTFTFTSVNTTGSYVSVIKYFNAAQFCSPIGNQNVVSCSSTNSFVFGKANTNAVSASCRWSCSCGTVIIDCSDGLGNCPAVPIDLMDFRAVIELNTISLRWETAFELNNSGFEILRSTDGTFYHKIGWKNGQGDSQEKQNYQWVDKDIRPNTNYYYRLNQIDRDGTNDYSPVITAMIKDVHLLEVSEIFPNPVNLNFAILKINTPVEKEARVTIFDGRGVKVDDGERYLKEGTNVMQIDVRDLNAGTYFAKLQVGQELWYRKILVQ